MNIVLDSNILFSALIKHSITRKIILNYDGLFLFPDYIFEEIQKHKAELMNKSKFTKPEFDLLLNALLSKVQIVSNQEIDSQKSRAKHIVQDIDPNDAIFIACVLAHPNSILWSSDKKLKTQKEVQVLNTKEIIDLLKK